MCAKQIEVQLKISAEDGHTARERSSSLLVTHISIVIGLNEHQSSAFGRDLPDLQTLVSDAINIRGR